MADFQNQAAVIKPEQILDIIISRRWLILIPLCISLTIGFIYTIKAPQTYKTSTTILIQPQRVPTDYVQSIITTGIEQRINSISQQILSRTNLEKIIQEFGMYGDAEGMYAEDKIYDMRRRVNVTQKSNSRRDPRRQQTEAFSVSFTGSDPEVVVKVVNKLASLFMDENLRDREIQASGTSDFLESELVKIKEKLEVRERELATYRASYMGGLPDELETNLRTLDRLQIQHTDALSALRDTQNSAALLKSQISALKEMEDNRRIPIQPEGSATSLQAALTTEQQYELDKNELDELLLKYTNKHPEVIKIKISIAKLKEKMDSEEMIKEESADSKESDTELSENSVLSQQEYNLKQIENSIVTLKLNIKQIERTMMVYQKRVEDTPKREQELQSIQRDYNNIRESYNSLLARRLEAELAVNMEKKQKGEQFRIIDYAARPEKPISPDVKVLFLISIVAGLGVAGVGILLLDFINPPIRSEEDVEQQLGLPVLACIPPIANPGEKAKKMIDAAGIMIFLAYAGLFFMLFVLINTKGINNTVNFLKMYINL